MKSKYKEIRNKMTELIAEIHPTIDEELSKDEEEDDEFSVSREHAVVGRWILFYETTAPALHHIEGETHQTIAKGFFTLSCDPMSDCAIQDWEALGMIEYAKDRGLLG